ncbi:hypothetical protein K443DRAFT_4162 [Laccaria amethystina LaAM-08-1]|uniref:DJ-1/PfpI domain-containing protein n=1 Tax=Laccaria amethystina LaAM-08-1 TaxID=1095629 RepID=A0A0C9YAE4_9AGAR|nr:hypothetical protein K443DRAFT_4162 [Laccaria amethystina LaAM-08-1]
MATPSNLRIAVLHEHQNLDVVGAMDNLDNHSQAYHSKLPTSHLKLKTTPNAHVRDVAVCGLLYPRTLDRPLIQSFGCTEFVKKRWADPNVLFLTVCTGSLTLAQTGVLNGRREAEQSGALGGRRKVGEGWEGVECCGGYGGIDLAM